MKNYATNWLIKACSSNVKHLKYKLVKLELVKCVVFICAV